jgi:hypothetical protein
MYNTTTTPNITKNFLQRHLYGTAQKMNAIHNPSFPPRPLSLSGRWCIQLFDKHLSRSFVPSFWVQGQEK